MRRQTLVLLPIVATVLAVVLGIASFIQLSARKAMIAGESRTVVFGSVRLPLPAAFKSTATRTRGAWSTQEFEASGVGTLWLSAQPLDGSPFEAACLHWFGMPAWPSGPLNYRSHGRDWFFRPIPCFGKGAWSMHKEGKNLRMVVCFDRGEHRHWVELGTNQGFLPELEVFDALILSIRDAGGQGPGPGLGATLAGIPGESGYRFLLPLELLFGLPVIVFLLPTLGLWAVGRRSGRLPEDQVGTAGAAFRRPFMEVGLVGGGQWKFFLACVTVVEGDLLLHTFGKPFLRIPKAAISGRTRVGQGWISPPFLEVPLDPPAEFLKWRWFYSLVPGRFRLRLYTSDLDALRVALGG